MTPAPEKAGKALTTRRIVLTGLLSGLAFDGAMAAVSMGGVFSARVAPQAHAVAVSAHGFDQRVVLRKSALCLALGCVFGGSMALVLLYARRREQTNPIDLEPGETLLRDGPANHWKGFVSAGGWLYLTDRRLRFRSHRLNLFANHDESFPLAQLVAVEPKATMGLVPNGFVVKLADWREEQFVVDDRASWIAAIESARGGAKP